MIVGAGENAEQVARAFHAHGVTTMFVANRRRDRAIALAQRFGGVVGLVRRAAGGARARRRRRLLDRLAARDHRAEELAAVMAERAGRPLLLVDLAVPRDIDPACAAVDGVTLLDMDALQAQVRGNLARAPRRGRRAEAIVEDEIQSFAGWLGRLEVLPTLTALRARGRRDRRRAAGRERGRWESLSERDAERVEAMARAVVNRLLHEPTARVRDARRRPSPRAALAPARAVRPRRGGCGRRGRGRRGPPAPRVTRAPAGHPRQRAGAGAGDARWRG